MKRNPVLIFIVMLVGICLAGYFGPWWAPSVVCVIMAALFRLRPGQAILISTICFLLVFTILSIFMLSKDESGLMSKTGLLLSGLSPALLVVVTALTGGITGIVSGWLGSNLGDMLSRRT